MRPYLLALCGGERDSTQSDQLVGRGRGIAVAVASLPGGKCVFATCRHNILNKVAFSIYDEDGVAVETSQKSMTLLIPKRDDLDLVLFVLPITVPSQRIRLSGQPIEKNTILSHARNIFHRGNETKEVFAISEALTRKSDGRAICSLGDGVYEFVADESAVLSAKEVGRQTFYNMLMMESRPGVSGSPLWDKYGAIRGIVCGGTGKGVKEPMLVYLPVRNIESELKIVLKNQKI